MTHPWRHDARETLTDHQKAELFLEKKGRCHRCTRKIIGEIWYAEHLIALQNGGDNSKANWDVTCKNCFPLKNAEDAGKAAKMRAVAVSCIVPRSQRQSKWKPIDGSKRSKYRKRMDGTVERRS